MTPTRRFRIPAYIEVSIYDTPEEALQSAQTDVDWLNSAEPAETGGEYPWGKWHLAPLDAVRDVTDEPDGEQVPMWTGERES